MNKLDQTDPRIQISYEEFLVDQDLPPVEVVQRQSNLGSSRVVELDSGRQVVLMDTAGRTAQGGEEIGSFSGDGVVWEPLRSNSGLFGTSKLELLKDLISRRKLA